MSVFALTGLVLPYSRRYDYWSRKLGYATGLLISLIAHLVGIVVALIFLENSYKHTFEKNEVFTVTLESGKTLGGISQVPQLGFEKQKVLPAYDTAKTVQNEPKQSESTKTSAEPSPAAAQKLAVTEERNEEKKLTVPSVVEDPEKLLSEQRAEQERKMMEEKKKQEEEQKKKQIEEQKKQEQRKKEEEQKKQEQELQKKAADEKRQEEDRKNRNRALANAVKSAKDRYRGESANAGGEGFGAATLGGEGMGGGTLQSLEFITYRNELERHIKSGWRWLPSTDRLKAQVLIDILPSGQIEQAEIVASSGNQNFDESVLRAIQKASPVPQPPERLYDTFKQVRITFDSHE